MTISKLIKELQKLQEEWGPRTVITVNKKSFWDGNGTFEICAVTKVEGALINIADGDGFHEENKDGSERMLRCVVLSGNN